MDEKAKRLVTDEERSLAVIKVLTEMRK